MNYYVITCDNIEIVFSIHDSATRSQQGFPSSGLIKINTV